MCRLKRKAALVTDDALATTRVASLSEILSVKDRSKIPPAAGDKPAPKSAPFATPEEWYVLIKGQQEGPVSVENVEQMFRSNKINARTYVWRDGMPDWLRLGNLDTFKRLVVDDGTGSNQPKHRVPVQKTAPAQRRKIEISEHAKTKVALAVAAAELSTATQTTPKHSTGHRLQKNKKTEAPVPEFPGEKSEQPKKETKSRHGSLVDAGYYSAPPGEATRLFMATAGLYARRRNHHLAAIAGSIMTLALASVISLDLAGVIEIPGMGMMYDMTGVQDPNRYRAIERTETKLAGSTLTYEERAALRTKLLGLNTGPSAAPRGRQFKPHKIVGTIGIKNKKSLSKNDRDLATDIFSDVRKQEHKPILTAPSQIQTPNLPDGLTRESIFKVINGNQRAMSLCISQAMKAGEQLSGKMEVEITIVATGQVDQARIATGKFKTSALGSCTVKTIKRWRFPQFNGEPITVIFPYVLSAAF